MNNKIISQLIQLKNNIHFFNMHFNNSYNY